jgi:hypothetical protein
VKGFPAPDRFVWDFPDQFRQLFIELLKEHAVKPLISFFNYAQQSGLI